MKNELNLLAIIASSALFWLIILASVFIIGSIIHWLVAEREYRQFIKRNNSTDEGDSN